MNTRLPLERSALYLVCAIITTVPLIFGAVHPIVLGGYVCLMLVGLGGWLLIIPEPRIFSLPSLWFAVPVCLILYIMLQSLPLPLEWVEILSPSRAARVNVVNELAGTHQRLVTLSDNGIIGFYRSFFLLALLFYFLTVKRLLESNPAGFLPLLYCFLTVGVFEALYGLSQFVNPQVGILWLSIKERATHGTIIYKNQYASLLNMIWPLVIAGGILFARKQQLKFNHRSSALGPLVFFFAACIISLAVLFSLSRGGILVMILVVMLLIIFLPFSLSKKAAVFFLFFCLLGGYSAMLGLDTLFSRFDSLDSSGAHRFDIYRFSLPMMMDHWLTGIGLGAYGLLSPVYLKGFPAETLYERVHSEYLELMIELGIPMATLMFAWMIAGLVRIGYRLIVTLSGGETDFDRGVLGCAAFCGFLGFLAHGAVDFGWRLPANLVYGMTLLAITVVCLRPALAPGREQQAAR